MKTLNEKDYSEIIVELTSRSGVQKVSLSTENLVEKSAIALDRAMQTIQGMSEKVVATIKKIKTSEQPSKVEVEFGIKLDAQAGAIVAQVGTEATIKVKLVWDK